LHFDESEEPYMTKNNLDANRENASKSTGPTTPEGKAVSSRNAVKHGVLGATPVLPGIESSEEWEYHRAGVIESLDPVGYFQNVLAERVALISWRLGRVVRYEVEVTTATAASAKLAMENQESNAPASSIDPFPSVRDAAAANEGQQRLAERQQQWEMKIDRLIHGRMLLEPDVLDKVARYEGALERSLFRTLHELQRIQAAQSGVAVPPPAVVDVDTVVHHEGNS
jgi:hypothetical protein